MPSMRYSDRIRYLLTSPERMLLKKLSTSQKIQDYLDTLPINFEMTGETCMSPRATIRAKTAHCIEGAFLAAAALAYHGHKPLLMDFQTHPDDEDHVVALFRQNGRWGAISNTNHTILRYRDPVYATPRELALSYFHEYLMWDGLKSLVAYSNPFDLRRYRPEKWVTTEKSLVWLADALDDAKHFPIVPKKNRRLIRKASNVELRAMKIVEWKPPKKFKQRG